MVNYTPGFDYMKRMDYLSKRWRELVHEYGVVPVEACLSGSMSLAEAREYCESNRQERQCQMNRLLCGPKLVSRSSFFQRLPRREGLRTSSEFGSRRKIVFSIPA